MFECRTCVWRYLRAIGGDANPTQILARRPLLLHQHAIRLYSSSAIAIAKDTPSARDELIPGKQSLQPQNQNESGREKSVSTSKDRNLKVELSYLQDRVKLAEHVSYTLRCQKPEKALDSCRLASKTQDVIVSWNMCVQWYLQQGEFDDAIKLYNEMKKRAQFPDSYTYSILLHGLALTSNATGRIPKSNVSKALSIYYSMSSPTSRVKPTILHTNNVLKVCSAGQDMDALWGVLAKLPEHGPGSPDCITYGILLDAVRRSAFSDDGSTDIPVEQIPARRMKAIHEGRAIWRDVIKKWRAGEISIDARLVASMSQLLLMSDRLQDWDDVLNLAQQTMNIPRQLPALDSPDRQIGHIREHTQLHDGQAAADEDSEGYTDTPNAKAFLPLQQQDPQHRTSPLAYVQPGNAILNHLITACTQLRSPKAANAYWDYLTDPSSPHHVNAERGNYHTLLKLIHQNRGSARACTILRSMIENKVTPNTATFRIVMGVCVRDKNNPNVLEHARTVIDVMEDELADLDVKTVRQYLNLALLTDDGPKIASTINRLDSIIHNFRSQVSYGSDASDMQAEANFLVIEEIIALFRAVVGAIDALKRKELVSEKERSHWQGRLAQLNAFVWRAKRTLQQERHAFQQKTGYSAPRRADFVQAKGMKMDPEEYLVRRSRWQEKKKRLDEEKADGRRANVKRRWIPEAEWRAGRTEYQRKGKAPGRELQGKVWRVQEFADSPMELANDGR